MTIEEKGKIVRFTDMVEHVVGSSFILRPRYINEPGSSERWTTRYAPYSFAHKPVVYLRSLFAGRIARIFQIMGDSPAELLHAIWALAVELHEPPNRFPWDMIRRSLCGLRNRRALPVARRVRVALRELTPHDEVVRFHALSYLGIQET